jgi:hypothetical protein
MVNPFQQPMAGYPWGGVHEILIVDLIVNNVENDPWPIEISGHSPAQSMDGLRRWVFGFRDLSF